MKLLKLPLFVIAAGLSLQVSAQSDLPAKFKELTQNAQQNFENHSSQNSKQTRTTQFGQDSGPTRKIGQTPKIDHAPNLDRAVKPGLGPNRLSNRPANSDSETAALTPLPAQEAVWDTKRKIWLTPQQVAEKINAGTIVLLGEEHVTAQNENDKDSIAHHNNQLRWLQFTKAQAERVRGRSHLGMEFLEYTHQQDTTEFLENKMTEAEFLQRVQWGGNPFQPYNALMQESAKSAGTIALNIPKQISRSVAKAGPNSLTPADRAFLPPIWERGGADYFARFQEVMGGHATPEQIENYFWAQSLWDSTMAWNATRYSFATDITTVVVGAFHVEFGHGLEAQIHRLGWINTVTMLQASVKEWEPVDIQEAIAPDTKYGPRADYIWVYLP